MSSHPVPEVGQAARRKPGRPRLRRRRLLVVFVMAFLTVAVAAVFGAHLLSPAAPAVAADVAAPIPTTTPPATPSTATPPATATPSASGSATASATPRASRTTTSTGPVRVSRSQDRLTQALAALPTGPSVEFSVAVRNNRTGATYQYRASDTYETASIVKVDVLAAVLLRAQDEERWLTTTEQSLAEMMIRTSDNDATTRLWRSLGGASGLRAANARLGLTATTPGTDNWGLTRTTVGDQITLLARTLGAGGPLNATSRAYIRSLMTTVNADQDWGVAAAANNDEIAAVKNGWLSRSTEDGRWIINSIGRITGDRTDLSIAVLSHGHSEMSAAVATTEQIARLVRQYLSW